MKNAIAPSLKTDRKDTKGGDWIWVTGILVVGAFLRWFRLARQSFWDDEIVTMTVSKMDLPVLWELIGSIDFNPPFYYVLLHFWMKLGSGEWICRSLSALLGIGAIGLSWRVGRQLVGSRAAIAGAALVAVLPPMIYSSQETRYYQLLACLCLACFGFLSRLLSDGRWVWAAGLAVSTTLLIYTHYYGFFFVAGIGVYLLCLSIRTVVLLSRSKDGLERLFNIAVFSRLELVRWPATVIFLSIPLAAKKLFFNIAKAVAALTAAGIAFVPFLRFFAAQWMRGMPGRDPILFSQMSKRLWIHLFIGHSPVQLPTLARPLERIFSSRPDLHEWVLIGLLSPLTALVVLGLTGRTTRYRGLLCVSLIVPVGLIFLLSIRMPVFDPRYLAPLTPFACLAAGGGLVWVSARSRPFAFAIAVYVLALSGMSLGDYYFKPRFARQDWRETARFVTEHALPSDTIAFYNYYSALPFNYYYQGETPVTYLFDYEDRYEPMHVRKEKLVDHLDRLRETAQGIWLIDYHGSHDDPLNLARKGLSERGYESDFRRCRLSGLYGFCLERYVSAKEERPKLFSRTIDFANGPFNEIQLVRGIFPGAGTWRWFGPEATAVLARPGGPYRLEVEFFADPGLMDNTPFAIRFDVDETEVGIRIIEKADVYRWESEILQPPDSGDEVSVRIRSSRTFLPENTPGEEDSAARSILIKKIAAIEPGPGEGM